MPTLRNRRVTPTLRNTDENKATLISVLSAL